MPNDRIISLIAGIALILITGCQSTTSISPKITFYNFPEKESVHTTNLGSPLIEKAKVYTFDGIQLNTPISVSKFGNKLVLETGSYIAKKSDSDWIYYLPVKKGMSSYYGYGVLGVGETGIRKSRTSNTLQLYYNDSGLIVNLKFPRESHYEEKQISIIDTPSYKQELLYNGKSGSEISVMYREFQNNMARPAFSQILKYDLSESDMIGFKDVRIKVLQATNTFIKYRLVTSFPDPK